MEQPTDQQIIRVLLADDHIVMREGMATLLSHFTDLKVVGQADTAQKAVSKAIELKPHVVVLDLVWFKDKIAGVGAIRAIKANDKTIKILAVTAYSELIGPARAAGAEMALDKDSLLNKSTLADRIRDLHTSQPLQSPATHMEALSEREVEVLRLVAQGQSDDEIANKLGIALSTAKHHVSNIIAKLNVNNRAAAVAIAYESEILAKGTIKR
jgi:two-component system, NarL family, response regulator LiaR